MKPKYLAVAGTMGVGKTTVAQLFAEQLPNAQFLEENVNDNQFLDRFYTNMSRWAFHSQLFFLQEKLKQTLQTRELLSQGKTVIQDTPIYQDVFSYAKAQYVLKNMDTAEFDLYTKMYALQVDHLPQPDLIVYLDADIDTIVSRINGRAREFENGLTVEYLQLLDKLNKQWIKKMNGIKVVKVDTRKLDVLGKKEDRNRLLQLMV